MWKLNPDKLALAALIAVLWPFNQTPWGSLARAGDHFSLGKSEGTAAQPASVSKSRDETPCVLLRNDNVLFGVARQLGEFVLIETGQGGEIKLSRRKVLCWAGSLPDLYQYRVDQRQDGDLSAIVRDARWCLRFDLYDLAVQEIRNLRRIDPKNTEAQKIEDQLRRQTAAPTITPASTAMPEVSESKPIKIVGYDDPSEESPPVDLNTLRRFASHVQPMLTNRCGRCHDRTIHTADGWSLTMPAPGSRASSRITRDNLTATLAWVDGNVPDQSPLLVKATTAHGGGESPLDARNAKAIESLSMWLWIAADSMAQPSVEEPRIARRDAVPQFPVAREQPAFGPADDGDDLPSQKHSTPTGLTEPNGPARLPQVANPFDPELFNRKFHLDSGNAK